MHIAQKEPAGLTDFEGEAGEGGAPWPAREPQQHGVRCGIPLRLHEVVEQLRPGRLLHVHVPGLQVERQRAVESREVGDHRRRRAGERQEEKASHELLQQPREMAAPPSTRQRQLADGHSLLLWPAAAIDDDC